MISSPEKIDLPQRHSLTAQSAAAIRKAIGTGVWRDALPSERRLCELLQVSRPTIRAALRLLAAEGRIEIKHGRRNRLLAPVRRGPVSRSRLVLLVSHQPIAQTSHTAIQSISAMRAHLTEHGFRTENLVCPMRGAKRRLEAFVRQNRVVCCVLISVGKELQEWFAAHAMPALVLGSCHPAVRLPSLDVDYASVCRHAVGVFRRHGHRRMALVVPHSGVAGDLASEVGFQQGCAGNFGAGPAEGFVVRHNGTAGNLTAKLDALFAAARPPTALLVAKPPHLLAVIVYLLKRGHRVPAEVSLIGRDWDNLFATAISHYRFDDEAFARRLSRLMTQLVSQGSLRPEPNLIFPRFVSGGTVRKIETQDARLNSAAPAAAGRETRPR